MTRVLLLDEGLPRRLADELIARGRPARALRGPVADAELLASLGDGDVLVTTDAALPREHRHALRGRVVAVVIAHDEDDKRETVHRWAHQMAGQGTGSARRYSPHRGAH
jgi:hypothetical protein